MVNLKPKVQASGLMDLALLGLAKVATEKVLTPVVGNGNMKSGAIKLIGGGVINSVLGGKAGSTIGGALFIDGIEDVITQLMGGMSGGLGGTPTEDAW